MVWQNYRYFTFFNLHFSNKDNARLFIYGFSHNYLRKGGILILILGTKINPKKYRNSALNDLLEQFLTTHIKLG